MPRFMLDTNSVSYALRGNPPSVREHLRRLPMAQVCISSITEAELLFGLALKPRPQSSPNSSINSSWASASCPGTPPLQKPTPTFAPCLGKRAAPSPPWTCSLPPTPSPPASPSSPATAPSAPFVPVPASPTGPSPSKRDSPAPARCHLDAHERDSCGIPLTNQSYAFAQKRRFEMPAGFIWRFLCCSLLLSFCSTISLAQNTEAKAPPVIDVHVHAMDGFPGVPPMCPNTSKFTASDPKGKEEQFGWVKEPCTPALYPSAPGEYMKDVLAEMERLNVTAVVFGDPKSVQKWKDAAPARVIPGTSFSNGMAPGQRIDIAELRKDFSTGGFKVMGEIGLQYEGISPSDPSVDAYFALAEELDI